MVVVSENRRFLMPVIQKKIECIMCKKIVSISLDEKIYEDVKNNRYNPPPGTPVLKETDRTLIKMEICSQCFEKLAYGGMGKGPNN